MFGSLSDGTVIAVMPLSSKSKQGNREFVNEIGMISALQHPNLVKLYGCCVGGNQLKLVYEYMENNCLSRALFERGSLSELVDPESGSEYSSEEAMVMLNVALLCTNASPTLRPPMSQVVSKLDSGLSAINTRHKALRNHFRQNPSQTYSMSSNRSYCSDSTNSWIEPVEASRLLRVSSVKSNY